MKPFREMNRQNTALLVIDVINSCAHKDYEIPAWHIHFTKIRKMIPKLNTFIDEFREKIGGPILFCKTVPWKKEFLAPNINELYEQEQYSYYSKDTSGRAEEFFETTPASSDLVFRKNTLDAFSNSKLTDELSKKEIKYIIITGLFTDGCILATTISGFSKGYNIIIANDLCETTDSPTRQLIQQKLFEYTFPYMFARVVPSNELLESFK